MTRKCYVHGSGIYADFITLLYLIFRWFWLNSSHAWTFIHCSISDPVSLVLSSACTRLNFNTLFCLGAEWPYRLTHWDHSSPFMRWAAIQSRSHSWLAWSYIPQLFCHKDFISRPFASTLTTACRLVTKTRFHVLLTWSLTRSVKQSRFHQVHFHQLKGSVHLWTRFHCSNTSFNFTVLYLFGLNTLFLFGLAALTGLKL